MAGIIKNGSAAYLAAIEKAADVALRDLQALMDKATTPHERDSLNAQMKSVREELKRKKAAAPFSLF